MSGIYRSMLSENSQPLVGNLANMLGARIEGRSDISIDPNGNVAPGTGGISVVPEWRELPPFLIPARLKSKFKRARGNDRLVCFRLGELPFEDGPIDVGLMLLVDRPSHGTIQPKQTMAIEDYQSALAATRDSWVIDED